MEFKLKYLTEADNLGRRTFVLDWVAENGRKRAQVFRMVPAEYIRMETAKGNTVVVVGED